MKQITSVEQLEALPVWAVVSVEIRWGGGTGVTRDHVIKVAPEVWHFLTPDYPEDLTSRALFHYHVVDDEDEWTIWLDQETR